MQNPIDSLFYLEFAGKNCYSADSPLAALLITASEPYTISGEKLEQVYRGRKSFILDFSTASG
jgi:hypothetical protein